MGEIKSCNEARKRQFQSVDAQSPLMEKVDRYESCIYVYVTEDCSLKF